MNQLTYASRSRKLSTKNKWVICTLALCIVSGFAGYAFREAGVVNIDAMHEFWKARFFELSKR